MKKEKPDVLNSILEELRLLNENFTKFTEARPVLVSPVGSTISSVPFTVQNVDIPPPTSQVTMSGGFPIPVEYREIVNDLLNKKFEIEIKYLADSASFEFGILVPKEYSNSSESHWQTYKEDRRSKVIQNAYGANGVREWVLHVYDNLSQEIRSRVAYDRAQL